MLLKNRGNKLAIESDVQKIYTTFKKWTEYTVISKNRPPFAKPVNKYTKIMKKEEKLNPLNDYLFMKYMGEPVDEVHICFHLWGTVTGMSHARREGIAIGEQRGEQKAVAKYISRLASKGMTVEEIAELAGLPQEEVDRFLK
jgi:hypothetical protein